MSYHNNIQFTELTLDDTVAHEDEYIDLLIGKNIIPAGYAGIYLNCYFDYAGKELQKAKQMFAKAFE